MNAFFCGLLSFIVDLLTKLNLLKKIKVEITNRETDFY